jgi:5-methylthioadenosine/S-adenosylhomocysteine deaminase
MGNGQLLLLLLCLFRDEMDENAILIKNAFVLSFSSNIGKADVLIAHGRIQEIGRDIEWRGATRINADDCYLLPSLANTHTHIAMTLLRGFGENLVLHEWLEKKIWPAEARLSKEDVYYGAMLGLCELVRGGATVFNEMYFEVDEICKATKKIGIKGVVGCGIIDAIPNAINTARTFVEKWKDDSLIKPSVCCHAPYTCSAETIQKAKEMARRENCLFHMHVSETRKELFDILERTKKRPIEYLHDLGIMDEQSLFAHMVFVSKREILLCGKRKITISHNPISNLKLAGGGLCPILEFDEAGALVTFGTDGPASNNGLSMLETLKMAALLQKHRYWDALALPAKKALQFASLNGWKALGFNAGDVAVGKEAELLLLKRIPNLIPNHDPFSNVVFSARDSNVFAVISGGKLIYHDGKIYKRSEKGNCTSVSWRFF